MSLLSAGLTVVNSEDIFQLLFQLHCSLYKISAGSFALSCNFICDRLLMSSLVISSKYVEVDAKGLGTVVLKNVQNNTQGPQHTILFKVKTNFKDSVIVRPGYGLIPPSNNKDTSHFKVMYKGELSELSKAKLLINWIAIEKIISDCRIGHEEFKQLFDKQVRVSEGTTLMPFINLSEIDQETSSIHKSQPNQQDSESSNINMLQEKNQKNSAAEVDHKFQSLSSDLSQKSSKKQQLAIVSGYSFKVLIFVFLISFFCGIFVGWWISPSYLLAPSAAEDKLGNKERQEQMAEIIPNSGRNNANQEEQNDL